MRAVLLLMLVLLGNVAPCATAQESILTDQNQDGTVNVLSFGDSITYGVGDGEEPGAQIEIAPQTNGLGGYTARIESLYGISVLNRGVPGEEIAKGGVARFPSTVRSSSADVVVVLEGVNDSIFRLEQGEYGRLLQKLINVAIASGKTPVLATLPAPCCNHGGREPFTESYSNEIRQLAVVNDLRVVDLERVWKSTCQNKEECELYNLPEGLHPNTLGYDVMGQAVLAVLLGIDVFAPDGAAQLEGALGLPAGSVIIKPEVVL